MLKTYLYVPEHLEEKINFTAKVQRKSKAEVMRQALEKGISVVQQQGTASAQALVKVSEIGRKYSLQGLKDGSKNLDKHLWSKDWDKNG